jgi:O-succinylbenzoate synthase
MARASIEMGAWALDAVNNGVALAELLGRAAHHPLGKTTTPRGYVETGIALGMHPTPEALADRAAAALAEGYRRVKLKISPNHDVRFVQAVREGAGPDAPISVDANGSYNLDDGDHVSALDALDTFGLGMIEQPLAQDDLVRHAELQRRLATRICLDESITGDASVKEMLALGSARVVNLKPGRVGGFQQALAIHDRCASEGIPIWCGGMLETGIGRAYNVALASLPGFTEPGDLSPSARYWTRDIVTEPWTMDEKGHVKVPLDRPGIGVDVDEAFVDSLTVRRATLIAD